MGRRTISGQSVPDGHVLGRISRGTGPQELISLGDLSYHLSAATGGGGANGAATYSAGTGLTLTGHTFSLTAPVTVALGGTNATSASGTALDNITGFSSTGLMRRTGAGTYTFGTTASVAEGGTNATSASGTALDNITGFSSTGFLKRTGAGAYSFIADPLPVANGGTNAASASGTALDNISGFSSTGFLKRTGAGAYSFIADPLPVGNGGTGIASGTSGGVPYFSGSTTIASSAALGAGLVVVGGGAGATPATIANGQLPATATNDSASSGNHGEYLSSVIAIASAVSVTTNTQTNVTTKSLTAGDWDVWGEVWFRPAAGTIATIYQAAVGTSSATIPADVSDGSSYSQINGTGSADDYSSLAVAPCRVSLSGTTTVYLVAQSLFTVSTMKAAGKLCARRVR